MKKIISILVLIISFNSFSQNEADFKDGIGLPNGTTVTTTVSTDKVQIFDVNNKSNKLILINDLTTTWGYLVEHWTIEPTLVSTTATGEIYNYTLNGVTRYRFVPTTYDPTQDAFYSDLALTTLIKTRG